MKIGFVGLGDMGKPMADHIVSKASQDQVIVNDINTSSYPSFESKGSRTTTNVLEVAQAEIIFLSLPGSQEVHDILLGEKGMINCLSPGKIIVDLSTIKYSTAIDIATRLDKQGIEFLDAPVSGAPTGAINSTLTVMCGGKKEVFDKVKPLLDCIGKNILYMGRHGNGQLAKMVNNVLYDINLAAIAEVLPMAVKMGLDPQTIGKVINSSTGRSFVTEYFIPRILKGNFLDAYLMKKAYKDLVSAAEISANYCIPMPVTDAATKTYQIALLKGYGNQDKGSMTRVFEELLGVEYRQK